MDIYHVLVWSFAGSLLGAVVGLLPALSMSVAMLLAFPLLMGMTPDSALAFYISTLVVSQYTGSVASTLLGVPGEASSLPSLIEGTALAKRGRAWEALQVAAVGSFVGSLVAIVLSVVFYLIGARFAMIYHSVAQAIILVAVIVVTGVVSENRWYISFLFIGVGLFLGTIGIDSTTQHEFLTFDNMYLMGGLPIYSVMVALYALPMVWKPVSSSRDQASVSSFALTSKVFRDAWPMIRGGTIGFFCGFVPSLSYIIASNISYVSEKVIQRKTYRTGNTPCLAASESANNAATLSCLIPMLVFGIPIMPSEAILFEVVSAKNVIYGFEWFMNTNAYYLVLLAFGAANIIGLILAWPLGFWLSKVCNFNSTTFKVISSSALIGGIYYVGGEVHQEWYYLLVTATLIPIGVILRKHDLLPLVFAFMMQNQIDRVLSTWKDLYV